MRIDSDRELVRVAEMRVRRVFEEEATIRDVAKGYISVKPLNQRTPAQFQRDSVLVIVDYFGSLDEPPTAVTGIPSSGNALAQAISYEMGIDYLHSRKQKEQEQLPGTWENLVQTSRPVHSFTTGEDAYLVYNQVGADNRVLIVDDWHLFHPP